MTETTSTSPKGFADFLQRQRSRAQVRIDGHAMRLIDVDVQRWEAWLDADELPEGVSYLDAGVADYVPSDALVYAVAAHDSRAWALGLTDEEAAADAVAELRRLPARRLTVAECRAGLAATNALFAAHVADDPRAYAAALEQAYAAGFTADEVAASYEGTAARYGAPSFEWDGPEAQACDECGAQPCQPCRPCCTGPADA